MDWWAIMWLILTIIHDTRSNSDVVLTWHNYTGSNVELGMEKMVVDSSKRLYHYSFLSLWFNFMSLFIYKSQQVLLDHDTDSTSHHMAKGIRQNIKPLVLKVVAMPVLGKKKIVCRTDGYMAGWTGYTNKGELPKFTFPSREREIIWLFGRVYGVEPRLCFVGWYKSSTPTCKFAWGRGNCALYDCVS